MITSRLLEEADLPQLQESLNKDVFHKETPIDFFVKEGTITNVYEDEQGPVLYVRGCKSLRLDIQFLNNSDIERNKQVMLTGFPLLIVSAKSSGFGEIIFDTSSPHLKRFCVKQLGFEVVKGDTLRRAI